MLSDSMLAIPFKFFSSLGNAVDLVIAQDVTAPPATTSMAFPGIHAGLIVS
jgi:hypothetical protein